MGSTSLNFTSSYVMLRWFKFSVISSAIKMLSGNSVNGIMTFGTLDIYNQQVIKAIFVPDSRSDNSVQKHKFNGFSGGFK